MANDSKSTFCTHDGCDRPRRARMLCSTHYNQPQRHRRAMFTCVACGVQVEKEASAQKHAMTYCSELCRSWATSTTPRVCALPRDHWARWYGKASTWSAPIIRNTGICAWCEQANHRALSSAYCSKDCKVRAKRIRRLTRLHSTIGTYTYGQLVRLWQAFDKRCAYCRRRTLLADIQAEHVTPLSRRGENHVGNLLPSCMPCNADKRDLLLPEWAADRARRNLPTVITAWSDDDTRYRHLDLALAA